MDKYDTSQLTEFPRFEPEPSPSGVSTFFSKLRKLPLFTPSEGSLNPQNAADDEKKELEGDNREGRRESEDSKTETGVYAVELEVRTLPNVLRRISSLIALGSRSGTRYADTELARYWMPDDISRECYECAVRFSTLRRRHHCRVCGQIFCSRCCSQRVPGHIFGCAGGLRVCNYCCNVVLSYLKENDLNGEISPDLRTLQESLQVKFPENKSNSSASREKFVFSHDQECGSSTRAVSEDLPDIYRQLAFILPTHQHRYRLVRYSGVWRGADILQWVMDNTSNKTRVQAHSVCQSLVTNGYMECVTEISHFADYALYKPSGLNDECLTPDCDEPEESPRIVESVSSYCLDLNLGDSSARLIKTPKADVDDTISTTNDEDEPPIIDHSEEEAEPKQVNSSISAWGAEHLRALTRQMLAACALPPAWLDVLLPLAVQAAYVIQPEADSNDIDIRNYVQVKKVPGGAPRDSCLIRGVVLTKNVAHRGMPQQISNPTVLLLDCSISYQRVEGKLTSLEPVLLQEHEYLSRCGARLSALNARVILARGGAGRAICTAVRSAGAALALRVRGAALRRAARCARADLVASLDARIGAPRLGTADNFYVKDFGSKTLMVLEGCANPHLGCCILLRGATLPELVRVKKIVKFMLLACYNWKLEKAFYADIEATLPEPGMAFDDEQDFLSDDKNTKTNDEITNGDQNIDKTNDNQKDEASDGKANENVNIDRRDAKAIDTQKDKITNDNQKDTKESEHLITTTNDHQSVVKTNDDQQSKPNVESTNDDKNEVSDPLQKPKYSRKTENLSCGVPIRDFSDPLRATLSVDDDVFLKGEETLVADTQTERWSADDVVLSVSPSVVVPPPFVETEPGRKCPLRALFPSPCVRKRTLRPTTPRAPRVSTVQAHLTQEYHPFLKMAIKSTAEDPTVKAALAHFRATGSRIDDKRHDKSCPQYKPEAILAPTKPTQPATREEPPDPFAPENHQKLHVLLYSYCSKSPNVPDFCVNPWVVTMESYGRHDITLGAFLDKYCFNAQQPCSSDSCHIPINQHIRKFVHNDVCITVTCNTIGHSNVDKLKDEHSKHIMFWSRCDVCGATAGARRLSRAALSLSLAQYVRGRAASAGLGLRARCVHRLHTALHAFTRHLTTAAFTYSKISHCDIMMPPHVISTNYDTKQMRDSLIAQLNELMLKGHEVFSNAGNEAEREQSSFKQHMDSLHVALSAPALRESSTDVVIRSLWSISDGIIMGEKMVRDAQEKWSTPPTPAPAPAPAPAPTPFKTVDEKSDLEDTASDGSNSDSASTTYVFTDNAGKEIDKEHSGPDEDEEKGDKKTIRQIVSQLLSSNHSANQAGMVVCGLVCVCVYAHETGSVIACALAAPHARRVARVKHSSQAEVEETENNATNKDKPDGEKSKAAKSSEHVEVMLKDGLVCRIYYAAQFSALRHAVIAPLASDEECCCDGDKKLCSIEEGYIRSLAHCVPWATRGGKSGSTFCKTKGGKASSKSTRASTKSRAEARNIRWEMKYPIPPNFVNLKQKLPLGHDLQWSAWKAVRAQVGCCTLDDIYGATLNIDDRYVLKEMTKPEWQQFLEFAPHYFNYVTACRQNNTPTLLARMVGVYSVGGTGGTGGGVLVLENVWYGCDPHQRYDLKGSSRHRLAPPLVPAPAPATNGADAPTHTYNVLMDENLLNLRWERPLYIRSHVSRALHACLARDTDFLTRHAVMDYSLLLAIHGNTLVLGIIDYIRTFTWDKKLEHLVKKNLGSGMPTVVSPAQYKARFIHAVRKYFLQCPEPWDHLYDVLHVDDAHDAEQS